jgi:hypothetical protein
MKGGKQKLQAKAKAKAKAQAGLLLDVAFQSGLASAIDLVSKSLAVHFRVAWPAEQPCRP